ncbi:MAG: hypothetical protein JNM46_04525 [Anaerolineales bacterium]|nr:hypothetical protein [Anaerolineales bacterium]
MLKPKTTQPNNLILWSIVGVLILAGIITLIISFSNANASENQVNAAYTSAAETLSAQQLTLQAASPTATPTLATATPSLTPTLFVTNTLPVLVSPTTSTGGTTGGGSGAVGCDNSVFVADVTIPDKTAMTPGQAFTKTWKLQNNGTCPWTTAYKATFVSGNAMGGNATALTITVQPGSSADISVAMIAPATAGTAIGYWRLSNANGTQFGTSFYVEIVVGGGSGPTATTGAATATTGAPASTATNTPEPTATLGTPEE